MVSLKQVDTYLVNVHLSEHPLIELNFKALQMIISFSPLNKKFSTLDLSSGCMTKRHITLKNYDEPSSNLTSNEHASRYKTRWVPELYMES